MNWRPWVTRTSATTPKENRIGSMPACRLRASTTILSDWLGPKRTILRLRPFPPDDYRTFPDGTEKR